jgi:hypothetical protein
VRIGSENAFCHEVSLKRRKLLKDILLENQDPQATFNPQLSKKKAPR